MKRGREHAIAIMHSCARIWNCSYRGRIHVLDTCDLVQLGPDRNRLAKPRSSCRLHFYGIGGGATVTECPGVVFMGAIDVAWSSYILWPGAAYVLTVLSQAPMPCAAICERFCWSSTAFAMVSSFATALGTTIVLQNWPIASSQILP